MRNEGYKKLIRMARVLSENCKNRNSCANCPFFLVKEDNGDTGCIFNAEDPTGWKINQEAKK